MDRRLSWLQLIGRGLIVLGILLVIIGMVTGPTSMWTLIGAMLIIAGVVKEAMIWIWVHLAHMGTDDHRPEQAP